MATATAPVTAARTFSIDASHSEVGFQVRHLITKVRGRFTGFAGTIEFDAATPARSSVNLVIQAGSIDTGEPKRDEHLKSADFFAVATYPTLTFASTTVTPTGGSTYDVEGDLTIHGVTRRIVLPVTLLGTAKDPWGNEKLAFETETTINRRDFDLSWNAALETGGFLVGDDVKISVQIQAA
jgi:polyisoprenoid-binding protein YceI